jgi:hypothetical protein
VSKPAYGDSVFINCPFDTEYGALLDAIVFAVHDCGYVARSSLERQDASQIRLQHIERLISECRFGIHDISRTEVDPDSKLPRFNMPLELGLFLGAKRFGDGRQRKKVCLILDTEKYRYQQFCSDIAGQDPSAHGGDPEQAIRAVRDWLRSHSAVALPGGGLIVKRYAQFRTALPQLCKNTGLETTRLIFPDYTALVAAWQSENTR